MSSNNCSYCYICLKYLEFNCTNICSKITIHTKTSIKIFLEQLSDQLIETENEIGICQECECKLNDYDLACLTAKNIEKDLRDLLNNSKKFFIKPEIIINEEENASDLVKDEIIDNDYGEFESDEEHNAEKLHIKIKTNEKKSIVRVAKLNNEQHKLKNTDDNEVTKATKVPRKRKQGIRKRRLTSLISDAEVPHDLKCTVCGIQVGSVIGYKNHLQNHKRRKGTEEREYCCKICGALHMNQIDLDAHIEKHKLIGIDKLQCVECGKEVTTRNSLFEHSAIHNGDKQYVCDLCGKSFIHRSSFRSHKRMHSNIRSVSCPICGQFFSQRTHLKSHILIHTGEKPYECSVCNRKFNKSYNMQQHMKIHDEKPSKKTHVCVICNQSYLRAQYLKVHMKKSHQLATTDDL